MKTTILKYWDDAYCSMLPAVLFDAGIDENGYFVIPETTIFYPGGGGQPMDMGFVIYNGQEVKIVKSADQNGLVKHYLELPLNGAKSGSVIYMKISIGLRFAASCIHTAGHWISGIITENLRLPLIPVKGYHYFEGPYIEFKGDKNLIKENWIDQINVAILIDRQSNLNLSYEVKNTSQSENAKPVRIVTIDSYQGIGCGGTHVKNIREIKSVKATKVYHKNGNIRFSYEVRVWETLPCSAGGL